MSQLDEIVLSRWQEDLSIRQVSQRPSRDAIMRNMHNKLQLSKVLSTYIEEMRWS